MLKNQPTTPITLDPTRRYHFVAIGGIGMSALAQVLLARGFRVSGSDAKDSPMLAKLAALGATTHVGHAAAQVHAGDVVVLSDAIKPENPEWRQADALGCAIIKRADLLGAVTNGARGVAVSGTHGKTTTSGMLSMIFLEAGLNPTCLLGGELAPLGSNARMGGALTVVEACEAYNSFLNLRPEAAVVTNVEVDHLDFHGTPEHLYASFRQFLRQVRGVAVLNGDDPLLRGMAGVPARAILVGAGAESDYRVLDITLGAEPTFVLVHDDVEVGEFHLRVPGLHNVMNAALAAALALEMGALPAAVQRGLAAFPGMRRRFERIGQVGPVAVVDDYAHHPTEIRATLAAARAAFPGRVTALFQPHLYSRTRDLLDDFAVALAAADQILLAPIYAAREAPMPGIDHHLLAQAIRRVAPAASVTTVASLAEAVRLLAHAAGGDGEIGHTVQLPMFADGDVLLTIGAGDVDTVAHTLVHGI